MIPEIFDKLIIPQDSSNILKEEGNFIYSFLKDKGIKKTIEIGFGGGYSAANIISATKSKHIVIDPYQKKRYNNLGIKNLKILNLKKFLKLKEDFSYNALPKLLKKKGRFDFAFIDGGHLFDEVMLDFYYIDLLLNQNGYVLFHDSKWRRSVQMVANFIKKNKDNYKLAKEEGNLILFQKIGEDKRSWDHFKEFYK